MKPPQVSNRGSHYIGSDYQKLERNVGVGVAVSVTGSGRGHITGPVAFSRLLPLDL